MIIDSVYLFREPLLLLIVARMAMVVPGYARVGHMNCSVG